MIGSMKFNGSNGSPAHAGIDPRNVTTGALLGWFPRTRGDRPGIISS